MLDAAETPLELRPTKMNIVSLPSLTWFSDAYSRMHVQLRQISRLVQGLESGDRVVFFCAYRCSLDRRGAD